MNKKLGLDPWVSMWTRPRETMRAILKYKVSHGFVWLSGAYGLNYVLGYMMVFSLGGKYPLWLLLAIAALLAIPVGMLVLTVFSALIFWLGKLIGGKGTFLQVRAAATWASVGYIPVIATWIVAFFLFGKHALIDGEAAMQASGAALLLTQLIFFIDIVAFVWILVLYVKGLGEVQGFSAWMGLLNVALVVMVVGALKWAITAIGS